MTTLNEDVKSALDWLKENFANYLPINGKAASATTADSANSATTADSANYANSAGSANSVAWANISGAPAIPAIPNAYVVSSWISGYNWWMRFSNGFVMQGGAFWCDGQNGQYTCYLHTNFATSNYVVLTNMYTTMDSNREACGVMSRAANSFNYYSRSSQGIDRYWIAFGY